MVAIRAPLNLLTYAACVLGVAPLYVYLDRPVQLVAPLALVLGVFGDRRGRHLLGRLPATLLSFVLFGLYALRISRDVLVEPVVNILVLLLAIRLLTAKSGRDYLQIFVLTIYALAGSSLLSLNLLFFPALVLLVLCVTVGLVLLTFYSTDPEMTLPRRRLRSLFGVALVLPAGSLLLMLVFFVILPRTQHPMWNFLNPGAAASSGFSETVRPGAFASNAASTSLAFRVECEPLPPEDLYWRGIVLNTLQGSDWVRRPPPPGEQARIRGGRQVTQTVYPEPRSDRHLFALDPPLQIDGLRNRSTPDLVHTARRRLDKRIAYRAVSRLGGQLETRGTDRDFYLQLPETVPDRLRATAEQLAASAAGDRDKIARTEDFFRGQNLIYATDDLPGPAAPLTSFLFEKKRGYCEFFAGAFGLLLRLEGLPARLVGGYHGGSYNDLGGYYSVTEATAHVWVEALVDGRWLRLDPSRLARNADSALRGTLRAKPGWVRRLLDAADYYWNQAVITYDLGQQLALLRSAGSRVRSLRPPLSEFPALAPAITALLLLLGAAWLARSLLIPPRQRLLGRFLKVARRRLDLAKIPDSLGLEDLARRLDDPDARDFARLFGSIVYRDRRPTPVQRRQLKTLLKRLEKRWG